MTQPTAMMPKPEKHVSSTAVTFQYLAMLINWHQFFTILDLEDDDLVAQCAIFFFAGFETTSTLLCFMAHELACNPDVQRKLYEEIAIAEKQLDGKTVTYEMIKELKYMEMVISETLRLWPPVFQTDRQVTKPYRLEANGIAFNLTTNDSVWIPIYGIHMVIYR